jgi:hypothetical protein
MPRQPPEPDDVPNVQSVSLSADDRKRFSALVDPMAIDYFDLPTLIGAMREAYHHTNVTPKDMAAGYERIIERVRREERTGVRDDELRARLQNPFFVDHVSYPQLSLLAADPGAPASELREAVASSLEWTAVWPQGERFNPRWEAVRIAVMMASAWFRAVGRPELRTDKAAQREFVLGAMAAAGLPTWGLRKNPARLDRDEVIGPWLALMRRA